VIPDFNEKPGSVKEPGFLFVEVFMPKAWQQR